MRAFRRARGTARLGALNAVLRVTSGSRGAHETPRCEWTAQEFPVRLAAYVCDEVVDAVLPHEASIRLFEHEPDAPFEFLGQTPPVICCSARRAS